ncbi:hypothetical protein HYU17_03695 [Candidatus Woesearchaeota archaeon]|nr:hypothetical protein [Candidatus Woesearchaeota archaeon]
MDEDNSKFVEECLKEKEVINKPGASPILTQLERNNASRNSFSNARYFLEGAKQIIDGTTPYLVFTLGFFAMEHAANSLIAQNGYKVTDHKCTQIFLSKMLNREDLAKALSRAYNARIAFNYRQNLSDYTNKSEAEEFLQNEVMPFVGEIEELAKGT